MTNTNTFIRSKVYWHQQAGDDRMVICFNDHEDFQSWCIKVFRGSAKIEQVSGYATYQDALHAKYNVAYRAGAQVLAFESLQQHN